MAAASASTRMSDAAALPTAIAFAVGIVYLLRAHRDQGRWAMDGDQ